MLIAGDTLISFFVASCLLGLAPGPDNLFVLTQSALRGKVAGLSVTLGLCTGLVGHTAAVALGLAALLARSPSAFRTLKFCGAAYLLWLAWQAFGASSTGTKAAQVKRLNGWQLYLRGIVMNITNPKVSIFFLAFLPQFADPARGSLSLQILLLGGVFIAATIMVFSGIALLAGFLGELLSRSATAQRTLNRSAGAVFIALALKLVLNER